MIGFLFPTKYVANLFDILYPHNKKSITQTFTKSQNDKARRYTTAGLSTLHKRETMVQLSV